MGLMDMFRTVSNPVRGSAQVVSTSRPPYTAHTASCGMHLVVSVPGYAAFPVDDQFLVKVDKWPAPGTILPIVADATNPRCFTILWDEVASWQQRGAATARQIADQMNRTGTATPHSAGAASVMINGRPASPEEIGRFEAATGMDLNRDGVVDGAADSDARLDALERLAALHASGALTTAEFEAEKRRLLGT
ncbi:SHOCT domain-containing protein [Gordonia sp. VNQ95]|jgi:hypothetical protein|uniref:SHOCT domain-containing protein n=1 Tax=Gordonia TaxID=2053 RepID=UPI0032B38656